jgi:propanol-preferring alcohol dehydrogenase
VLIEVRACGVCRTDLHVVEGDLSEPALPLILGHEAVGVVRRLGAGVTDLCIGQRVGVPWLGSSCGGCIYCRRGEENLCDRAGFTGYTLNGGYAELMVADERYCFAIPELYGDAEAAPLLCAGLIGFRSYAMVRDRRRLGLYGFGAAAHIIAQIAAFEGHEVFAFTRPGDNAGQEFARRCGATWAGGSDESPPVPLDAAILFAPVGALVPAALAGVRKGGVVVCAGIHMSAIPTFPYQLLWGERVLRSVANLTRQDGLELFAVAPEVPVRPDVVTFPLAEANEALRCLRDGQVEGAAVLIP